MLDYALTTAVDQLGAAAGGAAHQVITVNQGHFESCQAREEMKKI